MLCDDMVLAYMDAVASDAWTAENIKAGAIKNADFISLLSLFFGLN